MIIRRDLRLNEAVHALKTFDHVNLLVMIGLVWPAQGNDIVPFI